MMPTEDLVPWACKPYSDDVMSRGSPFRLQSAQILFSGRFTSSRRIFACRSEVALSCLDIAGRKWWLEEKALRSPLSSDRN